MTTTWADALDRCLERILAGQVSMEDCTRDYPQYADRLARLLPAAVAAREALQPPGPRPGLGTALPAGLRAKLRAARAEQVRKLPVRRPVVAWRTAPALAGMLLAVLLLASTTGVAWAARTALPRDLLYPVKRGLEEAQLVLSTTPAGDAALLESFADRRLEEIEALVAAGRDQDLAVGAAEYETTVNRLLDLAGEVPQEGGPGSLVHIDERLARHLEVLERVRAEAPEASWKGLERALDRSRHGREVIEQVLQGNGPSEQAPGQQDQGRGRPTHDPESGRPGDRTHTPGPPPWATPEPPVAP